MKEREKLGLMLGMAAMASAQSKDAIYKYENNYKDLPQITYPDSKPTRKSNLTPKQKKSRNKAKLARKARKQNR